jgi:aryl carrier-like protein
MPSSIREEEEAPALSRWQDAIRTVCALRPGRDPGPGISLRPSRDDELLANPIVRKFAPLLNPVLEPLKIGDNVHTRGLSNHIREENQLVVMLTVLRIKLRDMRGVVSFEDTQWMDSSSWALLSNLLPMLQARVLVVCSTRMSMLDSATPTDRASKGLSSCRALEALYERARRNGAALHLAGLTEEELLRMIADRLGVRPADVPPRFATLITERSAGIPLHVI